MTTPDGHLSPLDPRFPIALTHGIQTFGGVLGEWEDRVTLIDQTRRATEQAMRHEERFVTPAPEPRFVPAVPALAHEDTVIDMYRTDGDRFRPEDTLLPGEGGIRPEDTARWQAQREAVTGRTDHLPAILLPEPPSLAEEMQAAQWRPLRRAWRWLRAT